MFERMRVGCVEADWRRDHCFVKRTTADLEGENLKPWEFAHPEHLLRASCSCRSILVREEPEEYKRRSSAYKENLTVEGMERVMSFMAKMKRMPLRTPPCGTPSSKTKKRDRTFEQRT